MKQRILKIINWIKSNKVKVIVFLLISVLLFAYFFLKEQPKEPEKTSTTFLSLLATSPAEGELRSVWPVEKVRFIFDDFINEKTITYKITPAIKSRIIINDGPIKEFEILPLSGWNENTEYTITISKTLTSINNTQLKEDVIYKIKRVSPKPGDADFPVVEINEPGH